MQDCLQVRTARNEAPLWPCSARSQRPDLFALCSHGASSPPGGAVQRRAEPGSGSHGALPARRAPTDVDPEVVAGARPAGSLNSSRAADRRFPSSPAKRGPLRGGEGHATAFTGGGAQPGGARVCCGHLDGGLTKYSVGPRPCPVSEAAGRRPRTKKGAGSSSRAASRSDGAAARPSLRAAPVARPCL